MIKLDPINFGTGINVEAMMEDIGIDNRAEFITYATATAYKYMDKYVPKSNGHYDSKTGLYIPGGMLRKTYEFGTIDENNAYIEYLQPYARYQYYGSQTGTPWNYTTKTPVMTGPYWDLAMLSAEGEDYYEELQRFVDKRLK